MRLGEMLVRDGHATREQIAAATERQKVEGGRLGTILVEDGVVDLDLLTLYLGLDHSLATASGAAMDRAKRTAVRLLSPGDAARLLCVPLLISERPLIAAVHDPHDMVALDELTRITGYRIMPRVAPEIRIYYYIERYYGVPRPERFRRFGDEPRARASARRRLPALPAEVPGPALPGLPPRNESPVLAPTPAPTLRTSQPMAVPAVPAAYDPLDAAPILNADDLLIELDADGEAIADAAPPAEGFDVMNASAELPRIEDYDPMTADEARAAMESASQRGEIAEAVLGFARDLLDVACLFIVRDSFAFGWKVFGTSATRDRVEAMLIPLEAPSALQTATRSEDPVYLGKAFPCAIHRHIFKVLRVVPPNEVLVAVIRIGDRVVNLLYGHRAPGRRGKFKEAELDELAAIVKEAGHAYARLIAAAKREQAAAQPKSASS